MEGPKPSVTVKGTRQSSQPGRYEGGDHYWETELGCNKWEDQVSPITDHLHVDPLMLKSLKNICIDS